MVSHQGLNGIGNNRITNHQRHDQPFRGDGALPPVFAGVSIFEFPELLESESYNG
jgi:hypothetical protein